MKTPPALFVLAALALAGVAAGCADSPTGSGPAKVTPEAGIAPLLAAAPGQGIPDRYIVVFHDDVADAPGLARRLVASHGGELHYTYRHALRGFAATLPVPAVEAVRRNPQVKWVEQDGIAHGSTTQYNAPWGLDRIDQRSRPLNGTYSYYPTGAGVRVYVLDTGIRFDHVEFGGRAVAGYDAVTPGGSAADCNGHGTHVAGSVGGSTYGVAKGGTLVSVRVLKCDISGDWSAIIAGVDWVTGNHVKPAVANMSLGGPANTSLDQAVSNSIAAGVTYVIAAGNDGINACNVTPARVGAAVTVGATNSSDARAIFNSVKSSNIGSCLDLFAPGHNILSAYHTSSTATQTYGGTSMASPHVAGVAALYLQYNTTATPATVSAAIVSSATPGKLTGIGSGSPNRLLYSPLTPPVSVTLYCDSYLCDAYATGDYGPYSFTWEGATEISENGSGDSFADPSCPPYNYQLTVRVTVTAGNGETATDQKTVNCGP